MAPSILRDFLTTIAWWWDGGDCNELSLHGSDGMPPALGADVGSAVVSYGPAAGEEAFEPVRGTIAGARAGEQRLTTPAGSRRLGTSSSRSRSGFMKARTLPVYRRLD